MIFDTPSAFKEYPQLSENAVYRSEYDWAGSFISSLTCDSTLLLLMNEALRIISIACNIENYQRQYPNAIRVIVGDVEMTKGEAKGAYMDFAFKLPIALIYKEEMSI